MTYKTNVKPMMKERSVSNSALGRALGISSQAVGQWFTEEGSPPMNRIGKIAECLGVRPEPLLSNNLDDLLASKPEGPLLVDSYDSIRTMVARPGMGGPGLSDDEALGDPVLLPSNLIRHELKGMPRDFVSMEVEGLSMQPVLESGDHILIDRRKTDPSQGGLFVIWDGDGLVANGWRSPKEPNNRPSA